LVADATEVPEKTISERLASYPDQTISQLWTRVVAPAEQEVARLADELRKINPPSAAEISKTLAESNDPGVISHRSKIEDLKSQLVAAEEEARKYVLSGYNPDMSEDQVKAVRDRFTEARKTLTSVVSLVRMSAEPLGLTDVIEMLKTYEIPNVRGTTTRTGTQSPGSSLPRPRISEIVVSKGGRQLRTLEGTNAKLSYAATYIKSTTEDVFNAWLAAAEVDQWQDVNTVVDVPVGDYMLRVTPASLVSTSTNADEEE
jgi:hypothetical protein